MSLHIWKYFNFVIHSWLWFFNENEDELKFFDASNLIQQLEMIQACGFQHWILLMKSLMALHSCFCSPTFSYPRKHVGFSLYSMNSLPYFVSLYFGGSLQSDDVFSFFILRNFLLLLLWLFHPFLLYYSSSWKYFQSHFWFTWLITRPGVGKHFI